MMVTTVETCWSVCNKIHFTNVQSLMYCILYF